jgi:hypothetical protein
MSRRWYVGKTPSGIRVAFSAARKPTRASHGVAYRLIEFGFRTRCGAELYARTWNGGTAITAEDAEAAARSERDGGSRAGKGTTPRRRSSARAKEDE